MTRNNICLAGGNHCQSPVSVRCCGISKSIRLKNKKFNKKVKFNRIKPKNTIASAERILFKTRFFNKYYSLAIVRFKAKLHILYHNNGSASARTPTSSSATFSASVPNSCSRLSLAQMENR
jgi:hypothetical protein